MSKETDRIECLYEILNDIGVHLEENQVKKISEDFSLHFEMEHELSSYQHIGHKEKCQECEKLKSKLLSVEKERDIYHESVCKRRRVENDCVWIENGTVMYKK